MFWNYFNTLKTQRTQTANAERFNALPLSIYEGPYVKSYDSYNYIATLPRINILSSDLLAIILTLPEDTKDHLYVSIQ